MTSNRPPAATPTGTKKSSPPGLLDLVSTASRLTARGKTARASSTTIIERAAQTGLVTRSPGNKASHIKQTGVNTLPMIRLPLPIVAALANHHFNARRIAGSMIVHHAGTKDRAHSTPVSVVMTKGHTESDRVSRATETSASSVHPIEGRGGTPVPAHMLRAVMMREMKRRAARVAPTAQGNHSDTIAAASETGGTAGEKTSQMLAIRATHAFKAGQSVLLALSSTPKRVAPQRNSLKATTSTLTPATRPPTMMSGT